MSSEVRLRAQPESYALSLRHFHAPQNPPRPRGVPHMLDAVDGACDNSRTATWLVVVMWSLVAVWSSRC